MVEATGKVQSMLQVHVFSVGIAKVSGELTESEEMAPQVSRTESYPSHISALSATLLCSEYDTRLVAVVGVGRGAL